LVAIVVNKTARNGKTAGNGKIQQRTQKIFKGTKINDLISYRHGSGLYGNGKTHY
jgi:hypothetical protein